MIFHTDKLSYRLYYIVAALHIHMIYSIKIKIVTNVFKEKDV